MCSSTSATPTHALLCILCSLLISPPDLCLFFFFFNDTATTEIYTLSLHDALPIWLRQAAADSTWISFMWHSWDLKLIQRSEEHTSELQSPCNLVCRLLLEKKKKRKYHKL